MKNIISKIKDELQVSLRETDPENCKILAVYLFGSNVKSRAGRDSDLDLAFLLNDKDYKADPLAAVVPAYLAATSIGISLGMKTDVTILNASSLEMAYEAVTTGRCLVENDTDKRIEYEIALRGMYFDFKPFLDELRSNCVSNL